MKDAIIYVPQGRGAYLTVNSKTYRVGAAYTDQFSTCQILMTVSANDITLFHLDALTDLQPIIQLISGIAVEKIFVLHRGTFNALTEDIINKFQKWKPQVVQIPNEIKGVSVSHQYYEANHLHPFIKLWHEELKPTEVLHHPREKEFNAVQKIEQLIGFRSRQFRRKTPLVFAVIHWNVIDESECRLDLSNPITTEDFNQFKQDMTYMGICSALRKVASLILEKAPMLGDVETNVVAMAEYLESYLHNYDGGLIFIANCRWLIDETTKKFQQNEISVHDLNLLKQLAVLLQNKNEAFRAVKQLTAEYIRTAPDSAAKNFFVQTFVMFCKQYQRRNDYVEIECARFELAALANQCKEEGFKLFQNNKGDDGYKVATDFFASQYVYLVHSQTIDHSDFASCNYNIGRCLQRRNQPEKALKYLKHALKLRQDYAPHSLALIEKYRKAIEECETTSQQALSPQASAVMANR